MVKGLPLNKEPSSTCECCILAKKHSDNFPKVVSYRAHTPLDFIHVDLFGPMKTQSHSGSLFFLTIIDDFNRKTWVCFFHHKSKAFGKFKEFKAFLEN